MRLALLLFSETHSTWIFSPPPSQQSVRTQGLGVFAGPAAAVAVDVEAVLDFLLAGWYTSLKFMATPKNLMSTSG